MDEENNNMIPDSGGGPPGSGASTFKRVIAILAVLALLAVGVGVLPVFLAGRQAEINKDTQKSNSSYSAAAQLKLKIPTRGLSEAEAETLVPESELLTAAEVDLEIPYSDDNKCAVIYFESSGVSVETDAGTLRKNALSEGIVVIWTLDGTGKGKLNASEGEKKYEISLEDAGNGVFKGSVASAG